MRPTTTASSSYAALVSTACTPARSVDAPLRTSAFASRRWLRRYHIAPSSGAAPNSVGRLREGASEQAAAAAARPNSPSSSGHHLCAARFDPFFADDAAARRKSKTHFLFVTADTFASTDSQTSVVTAMAICARRCLFTACIPAAG